MPKPKPMTLAWYSEHVLAPMVQEYEEHERTAAMTKDQKVREVVRQLRRGKRGRPSKAELATAKRSAAVPRQSELGAEIDKREIWADALADVQCWFRGFRSARGEMALGDLLPPGLDALRDLKIWLEREYEI